MVVQTSKPRRHGRARASVGLLILLGLPLANGRFCGAAQLTPDSSPSSGSDKSVLDGVFSEGQRRKGMQVYLKQCSSCHGERLRGGESAPALTGTTFREHWVAHTLDDLMQKINLMPPKDPGHLTAEEASSVIALILAVNGFPSGNDDLPPTSNSLGRIRIDPPRSP
jgi:mono/diheme cytochrome c family protein